jgi:hypothetical protein
VSGRNAPLVFQRANPGNHFVPGLECLGAGRRFILAGRDDRRTRLPADRAADQVNDFLAPTRFAAGNATYMGFRPAGTFSFSHIQELSGFK